MIDTQIRIVCVRHYRKGREDYLTSVIAGAFLHGMATGVQVGPATAKHVGPGA